MKRVYITYLDHLGKYRDRFRQICEALPDEVDALVFTKNAAGITPGEALGGRRIRIEVLPTTGWHRSPFLQWRLFLKVRRFAPGTRIIIQDWFKNFALSLMLRKFCGADATFIYSPVISDFGWIHKRITRAVPSCGLRYDLIRARGAFLDWYLCHRCDILLVQSRALVDFYRKTYGLGQRNIEFNYNAYEDEEVPLRSGRVNSPIQLGFVGNFERHKGACDLIKLVHRLPNRFVLRLVGQARGKENRRLLSRIQEFTTVRVEGLLDRDALERFYGEIDALLLPSYHEGSPRVIREFLGQGRPIFLYENPGVDYCRNVPGVYIFPYGRWRDLVNCILGETYQNVFERTLPPELRENRLKSLLGQLLLSQAPQ